jgi:uncharacterized protein (DUF885 family)
MENSQNSKNEIFNLSEKFVNEFCKFYPTYGTGWGINTYDDKWDNLSVQGYFEKKNFLEEYVNNVSSYKNKYPTPSPEAKHALYTLETFIQMQLSTINLEEYYYDLNGFASTLQNMITVFDDMKTDTLEDWNKIVKRLETFDVAFEQYTSTLRAGMNKSKVVAIRQVTEAIKQTNSYIESFGKELLNKNKEKNLINESTLRSLCDKASIFSKFTQFLSYEYIKRATVNDAVGFDRYKNYAKRYIGNDIDINDTYSWGYTEVTKLVGEINMVCKLIDPTFDPLERHYSTVVENIKNDKNYQINTIDEFLIYIQKLENNAIDKLEQYFEIPEVLKKVDVKQTPLDLVTAYYVPPSPDFSRNGCIRYGFEKNVPISLYDQVSTAYHEGFPGHHLQCGYQVYLENKLSLLSRLVFYSGYGEGWALYTERFMMEVNMYDDLRYVLGMLMMSMFRACRVIIDIGIHCNLDIPADFSMHGGKPMTYEIGKEIIMKLAGLSDQSSTDEMNRYTAWPGQAISYKVGERTMFKLRNEMQLAYENKNKQFNYKDFHSLVLNQGCVSLEYLENYVRDHINKI